MSSSLGIGVSALLAHQRMLDTVGNNLANLNTTGYKAQRVLFSDLLYTTMRPARSSNNADFGSVNPIQVGSGVKIAQIDRKFTQGNLEATGVMLDFAIQGDGFFVANDGIRDFYTRAGALVLDESGRLVDATNGYQILRLGTVGEPDGVNPGFQTPGDPGIVIPFGATIPGQGTSEVSLQGNLDASATGPLAETATSTAAYTTSGAAATAATLLDALDTSTAPFIVGDTVLIAGTDVDGTPVSAVLNVDGTTTMGDLIAAISATYGGATASVDAQGNVVLTADTTGDASLSLTLNNGGSNSGGIRFADHVPIVTTEGKEGDIFDSALEVFDTLGAAHKIQLVFQKTDFNSWEMSASISAAEGTMIDGSIQQIEFGTDGSMQQVLGSGLGDAAITFQINGMPAPQTLSFSLGTSGEFDGLTHLATDSSLTPDQDGFGPGRLSSINVSADGILEGVASNGRIVPLAQLAIASFRNVEGLSARGDNFFEESLSSGQASLGAATAGNRGSIQGASLEGSNVDIALEFTRLIIAQRGFSANARTITVTDEVLQELTNLI